MPFPKAVKEQAAVACNRCCCICHEFKGIKLEFHHIKQEADGGENTFENCIPLCFDCHADMGGVSSKHPKGNSYSEKELRMHRDKWYQQCVANPSNFEEISVADIEALFSEKGAVSNEDNSIGNKRDYGDKSHDNVVSVAMQNAARGHTVIIDSEKYIAARVIEEHDREIENLLKKI